MDPKIARIFETSRNISGRNHHTKFDQVDKGKSHKLLHKALLNDTKVTKKLEEEELNKKIESIHNLKNEIDQLRSEIQKKNIEIDSYGKDQEILSKLYDIDIIDENGDLISKDKIDDID